MASENSSGDKQTGDDNKPTESIAERIKRERLQSANTADETVRKQEAVPPPVSSHKITRGGMIGTDGKYTPVPTKGRRA